MRAVVQRVSEGGVYIDSEDYKAEIGKGIVILLGVNIEDTGEDLEFLVKKCSNLRIFDDEEGKMNLSVQDVDGEVLVISQFTLYGDAQKGNRPSYIEAARPPLAEPMYDDFVNSMKAELGDEKVKRGIFGAMMQVKIINDGPVTIIIESRKKKK